MPLNNPQAIEKVLREAMRDEGWIGTHEDSITITPDDMVHLSQAVHGILEDEKRRQVPEANIMREGQDRDRQGAYFTDEFGNLCRVEASFISRHSKTGEAVLPVGVVASASGYPGTSMFLTRHAAECLIDYLASFAKYGALAWIDMPPLSQSYPRASEHLFWVYGDGTRPPTTRGTRFRFSGGQRGR